MYRQRDGFVFSFGLLRARHGAVPARRFEPLVQPAAQSRSTARAPDQRVLVPLEFRSTS